MTTAAGSADRVQVSDAEISRLSDAKRRLAAKVPRLVAMQQRAKAAGNTKLATEIAAELKEADALRAQIAGIETAIRPFMDAYSELRLRVSDWFTDNLGALGALWIPAIAAAGITAVVYAVNTWDRKTETSLQRYESELRAHDEWVRRGKTGAEATALVKQTAQQFSKENENRPGLFSELNSLAKLAGVGLLAYGVWQFYQSQKKSKTRAA
ncbi:MAG: hypothetical protein K0S46_2206 [Moraxellaceae bacterium]|jgi:hypothetical protein|nr:hypothetical protein [Moraxellaceae bacterium]